MLRKFIKNSALTRLAAMWWNALCSTPLEYVSCRLILRDDYLGSSETRTIHPEFLEIFSFYLSVPHTDGPGGV